ncbi:glycosyltransferase [Candidatus Peregrinibacteria bacterium]|nr:MAG: glycosyltransferase [Candidatus Peregrinibacteria bacterium]
MHKKASLHTKRRGVVPPLFFEKSEYERIQKIRQKKVYFPHFRVSLVGRIDTWKGQDILLEIAKKCQEDGIQNIHFSFFGTSSSYDPKTVMFEKSLHNFAKENNLTNVSFHGYCEPETIFSETNLLIHASTEHEPFGRTIAEAALIGIPIIASRFSGAAPYFSSLPYVRLIENPRNIEEVFALIVKAKEDFSAGPRFFLEGKELWKYFQDGRIRMTEIWQNTILPQRSPDKS